MKTLFSTEPLYADAIFGFKAQFGDVQIVYPSTELMEKVIEVCIKELNADEVSKLLIAEAEAAQATHFTCGDESCFALMVYCYVLAKEKFICIRSIKENDDFATHITWRQAFRNNK